MNIHDLEPASRARQLPPVIQGGMGVGVSSWRLARRVANSGGLGVISGVASDLLVARWLQDGDLDGHVRAAMAEYPDQDYVAATLKRFYRPAGREPGTPFRPIPRLDHHQKLDAVRLAVLGAFVQVRMAKQGHDNPVGINLLEKIQLWTPATLYGAMLAGVDAVLVGAGLPTHIPRLLDDYANGRPVSLPIDVAGSESSDELVISLVPHEIVPPAPMTLPRPVFLAIISSHILGAYLARDDSTRPDGFVVEGPTAGGHNAPPRRMELDEGGEPIYGERDVVDLDKLAKVGLPYWLAGGQASPKHVVAARAGGAQGVQIGTVFALCHESGLSEPLRTALRRSLDAGTAEVRTDPRASPTGFPFKVVQMAGTVADPAVSTKRERICDLGYLRTPYRRDDGTIGQRCPSEPIDAYLRKGGVVEDTEGRKCLCNGLMSSAGVPQIRPDGGAEPPLLTLGQDLEAVHALLEMFPDGWSAADVMQWLLSDLGASGTNGSSA